MVPQGDKQGGELDDQFDELDAYFTTGPAPGKPGRPEEKESSKAGEREPAPPSPEAVDAGLEDEILPPGWAPDVGEIDFGEEERRHDESPDAAEPPGARELPEEPEGAEPAGPPAGRQEPSDMDWGPPPRQPDAEAGGEDVGASRTDAADELTGEDWTRLRDALRAEEGGDLTLEDLKKAPPEYRDLPGVYDATVQPETPGVEREGAGGDERRPFAPDTPPEPYWDEPGVGEVAAADRLGRDVESAREPEQVEKELLAGLDRPGGPRTVRVGPESMLGPAWEEPTSHVVTGEPVGPLGMARDMPAALLTAAVLAVAALISLAWSKAAFAVVASLVVLLGQAELYATMHRRGHQPATALGLVVGGLILAGAYLRGEQAMLFFVALGLALSFLWYMAAAPKSREAAIGNIGSTMFGIVYVPFLAGFILVILSQPNSGRATMMAVLGLTFLYDVSAFAIGTFWGARALAPTISPKKSWEGLLGATVVTFAVAVAALPSVSPIDTVARAVGLALVVVIFAPLGDLAESAIKRDLGVKDMGSILPGHGGILDRIDSVLFVAPAAFYFLRLVF
jgi:phosphatidate cytidylyltransferase